MRGADLSFMLAYDVWAMARLLDTATELSDAQFNAPSPPGQSPRATVLHCVDGIRGWRGRLAGVAAAPTPQPDDYPTPAAVRALWDAEHRGLRAYVTSLSETDLDSVIEHRRPDRYLRATRWQIVLHLVLHTMQHRSELAETLTRLGHSPGELGLTAYLATLSGGAGGPSNAGR